ncbi:Phosphate import ATP-binding protein pstB [Actinobacillus pleuropneumoniae serovar 11 str. 56153]|uniref:Phosphate ABC transporter ATP-binding protein n=2 Tax=Actinobacillus pleuropneumoniae TaxID=715 RepID=A0ABN5MKE3_ACTPL|nr:hypothetical protein [Actinobacillus pleuropneumoniae]AWG94953.1 phosphate ABC transporter ATP-binding protein [Actinobacillus pleuropneumoniae serovar 1 str. 4074]EFM94596.1 Phosphate import ATP-binding protein pstB [Actinobacillus pleuropneumoniae serovar 9 str. CVJ13261]EFM96860.1 Phosphate import ATP-binding protein pstB [Actinobacillus pleuropneumoniae serovar 10 str. D13039]EFM99006.1 Phosphate import ATP-binding protein pstB [Actinobacillus pleuropneumoniae serovar 11 str. 56153]AXA2
MIEPSNNAPRFGSDAEQWQLEQQLLNMLSNQCVEGENV